MRKISCLFLLIICAFPSHSGEFGDVIDEVTLCFKKANAKELAAYFSSSMSIAFRKDEGVYSKVQSEIILREFFNKNIPNDVEYIHRLESNPNIRYVVLLLSTSNGTYRISYKLVSERSNYKMTELRIE